MRRRFVYKILLGGIIVFILDFVFGAGLRYLYYHRAFGNRKNLIHIIEDMNDPIVIMGSSRAQHHYVPSLFQAAFDKSCFNAGLDGAYIEYHEALLKTFLNRYVPEMVILDFNQEEFEEFPTRLRSVSRLLPFSAEHPELRSLIYSCGRFERIRMLSKIYPFNSEIYSSLVTYFVDSGRLPDYPDGYIPLSKTGSFPLMTGEGSDQSVLNAGAKKAFKAFVSKARQKNISLYIIISPSLIKYMGPTKSMTYAQTVCRGDGIPFWDLSASEAILQQPEYFQDRTHLNDRGARVFSQIVIDRIKGLKPSVEGEASLE